MVFHLITTLTLLLTLAMGHSSMTTNLDTFNNPTTKATRYVSVTEIHSLLQLLASNNQMAYAAANSFFSHIDAIAAAVDNTDLKPLHLNVTVNDELRQVFLTPSNFNGIDRVAGRFCTGAGLSSANCIQIRQSLVALAQQHKINETTSTAHEQYTLPALITQPSSTASHFYDQKAYFNVTTTFDIPTSNNDISCFHLDFAVDKLICGPTGNLSKMLVNLPRPSFTRKGLSLGWHTLSIKPNDVAYSSDYRFFKVVAPSVRIDQAILTLAETNNSYHISLRIHMVDFRPGTDGTYCVLLDWQVVGCSQGKEVTTTTFLLPIPLVKTWTEQSSNASTRTPLIVDLDIDMSFQSHRQHQHYAGKKHNVAVVLKSTANSNKAVAVSNVYPVTIPSGTEDNDGVECHLPSLLNLQIALPRIRQSEWGVYSQNGEDGILLWILSELGMLDDRKDTASQSRYFVEFGVEDGYECNTRFLRERFGWQGLLMDGSNTNASLNLQQEFITAEGINELFDKYSVPLGERKLLLFVFAYSALFPLFSHGLFCFILFGRH